MAEYREGQTATNPKTGQKIVFQGGLWVAQGGVQPTRKLTAQEEKSLTTARSQAEAAIEQLPDLNRFQEINDRTPSGGFVGSGPVSYMRGLFDPNVQQMKEIGARLAPAQRVPGSGTTSDRDLALFQQAVPGIDRAETANDAIIERGRQEAVRRQMRADFYDQYAEQHGTLRGAEQAYRATVGQGALENPLDFSRGQSRATAPRGAYYRDPQGNVRRNDNGDLGNPVIRRGQRGSQGIAPTAEQQRMMQTAGAKGPRGTSGNPILINARDPNSSYANVPAGAYFITPDGQLKKKGR